MEGSSNNTAEVRCLSSDIGRTPTVTVILSVGCVQFIVSVSINVLLSLTICSAPTLKTPPNFLLINICINNVLSSLGALLEFLTIPYSAGRTTASACNEAHLVLAHTLVIFCYIVYWNLFAAVANYRLRTLRNPRMSTGERKTIICASLVAAWAVSVFFAIGSSLSLATDPYNVVNATNLVSLADMPNNRPTPTSLTTGKLVFMTFCILDVLSCLAIVLYSFSSIFKVLFCKQALRRNRIVPVLTARSNNMMASSSASANTLADSKMGSISGRNHLAKETIFTISKDRLGGSRYKLHFESSKPMSTSTRRSRIASNSSSSWTHSDQDHSDVLSPTSSTVASDNDFLPSQIANKNQSPAVKANNNKWKWSTSRTSNSQRSITISKESCDFTDITVGAELYRLQFANQRLALRQQLFHCHQLSGLSHTIRNNVTMVGLFTTTSIPFVVAMLCRVFAADSWNLVLFFYASLLILNLSGTLYPIWYLIATKKVRSSLHTIVLNVHRKIA